MTTGVTELFGWMMLAVAAAVYCLPWIVAAYREHEYTIEIGMLTLLTGWLGLPWVALLAWAILGRPTGEPVRPSAGFMDMSKLSSQSKPEKPPQPPRTQLDDDVLGYLDSASDPRWKGA